MSIASFICAECEMPFASKGGSPLCRKCSIAADVIICGMVAQGHSSKSIAIAVKLTAAGVNQRRARLKLSAPAKPKPAPAVVKVAPRIIDIGPSISRPTASRAKRWCLWPSGDPNREMHICCRVPETGDIRCDNAA